MRPNQYALAALIASTSLTACSAVQSRRVDPPAAPMNYGQVGGTEAAFLNLRALSEPGPVMDLIGDPVGADDRAVAPVPQRIIEAGDVEPGQTKPKPNPLRAGLTYFMPRQLLRFTVSKTDTKREKLIVEKAKLEDDKKALDTRLAVVAETIARTKQQLAELSATSTLRAAIQTESDRAAMDKIDLDRQIAAASGKIATNAKAMAELVGEEQLAFKVEALPMAPDPDNHYVLNVQHSWLRDDEVKLTITTDGLLSSADIITTGRLPDILAEGATALGKLGVPPIGAGAAGGRPIPTDCYSTTESITRIIDPVKADQLREFNLQLLACGFAARVRYGVAASDVFGASFVESSPNAKEKTAPRDGIYYRTAVPIALEFEKLSENSNWTSVKNFVVSAPQAGPIAYLPSPASLFTKNKTLMTFKDGMVTNWNTDQPSELLEILRTPERIVNNLAESASELVQLRLNVGKDELSELSRERELLIERDKLRRFKECLDKAAANGSDTAPCYDIGK